METKSEQLLTVLHQAVLLHDTWHTFHTRFIDILPYDGTRVTLQQIGEDPTSHYINASYIDVSTDPTFLFLLACYIYVHTEPTRKFLLLEAHSAFKLKARI